MNDYERELLEKTITAQDCSVKALSDVIDTQNRIINLLKSELNKVRVSLNSATAEKLNDICEFRHEEPAQVVEFLVSRYHKENQPNI